MATVRLCLLSDDFCGKLVARASATVARAWATKKTPAQACPTLPSVQLIDLRATGLLDFRLSVAQLPDAPARAGAAAAALLCCRLLLLHQTKAQSVSGKILLNPRVTRASRTRNHEICRILVHKRKRAQNGRRSCYFARGKNGMLQNVAKKRGFQR